MDIRQIETEKIMKKKNRSVRDKLKFIEEVK